MSSAPAMTGMIGQPLPRLEDDRLVRGKGSYSSDFVADGKGHAIFVRSDVAHGRIRSVRTSAAAAHAGVRLVLACTDEAVRELGDFPALGEMDGQTTICRPVMPREEIRHVGEILAMVVADTPELARDAAASVEVEIESLPASVDLRSGGERPCYEWQLGDRERTGAVMASAAFRARVETASQRLVIHPMETRAALASHDAATGIMELVTPSQGAHKMREMLLPVLGVDAERLIVRTPDVGGAFGMKLQAYPEHALCLLAARMTGRPVKWEGERSEASLMDAQGRAQWLTAELALDAEGRFLALDIDNLADIGAYATGFAVFTPSVSGAKVLGHAYAIGDLSARVCAVYSHTVPVDAYRGAGKPEMIYIVERVIEEAARVSGIDPVELRRRNLLPPQALPKVMPMGQTMESGDFGALFERTLEAADHAGFAARRERSRENGFLRGFGVGMHMHCSGGFTNERSILEVAADGTVTLVTGTQAGGQGHETAFAQIVAERLGIRPAAVRVLQGDTGRLDDGGGTGGSSSLTIAGANIVRAADLLIEEARERAARLMEAAAIDVLYKAARFTVAGTDRSIGLFELAGREELVKGCDFDGPNATFPNGCYVAEVEIDPETGELRLDRFTGLDDIGRIVNPLIAMGQIHGGIVQGLGQALCEACVLDASGQLLTATFMDYAMPRAMDLPPLNCGFAPTPTAINVLGAKGAGELSPTGAMAPVVHAALDALAPCGVRRLDMPLSAARIWQAMRDAGTSGQ